MSKKEFNEGKKHLIICQLALELLEKTKEDIESFLTSEVESVTVTIAHSKGEQGKVENLIKSLIPKDYSGFYDCMCKELCKQ